MTDHLGNVVVYFSDTDGDGEIATEEETMAANGDAEVLQRNYYYPFGLRVESPSFQNLGDPANRYLYNGKELQDEGDLEIGWLYYGARMYDPEIGRFTAVDPLAHKMPAWSPYSYTFNNPVLYTDPDGRIPIIPWLLKAGANAGADMLAQASMAYYFDPNVTTWGQAFDNVNYYQVARSGAEGLIPWRTPGGRLGRAALTAAGDVVVNAANDPSGYTKEQAGLDFATGFIGDLSGGGLGELVTKYGTKSVATGLVKLGFDGDAINDMVGTSLSNSDIRTIRSQQKIISEHQDKLAKYKANPDAYDNKGHLKNAPNDKVRQKIIDSRIKHLNDEINAAQKNINDVFNNSGGARP